jgi:hypothetical protein
MSAYIKSLERDVAQAQAAAAQARDPLATLKQRIGAWQTSLPPVSRNRRFAMREIMAGVGAAQQEIGPALIELGWSHCRHHTTVANVRYWTPPGVMEPRRRNG